MLALRGVLLALMSSSAQIGVQRFHSHDQAQQQQQQQAPRLPQQQRHPLPLALPLSPHGPPSTASHGPSPTEQTAGWSTVPAHLPPAVTLSSEPRRGSASIDAGKVVRIAERMCGLKGDELSIPHMCDTASQMKSGSSHHPIPACECASMSEQFADRLAGAPLVRSFSGWCAIRWLLRSGLVDGPDLAVALCRRMIAERAIQPMESTIGTASTASAPSATASPHSSALFYSSPRILYTFGAEYSCYQSATEADIDRLSLHTRNHADIIAALCKHYNHKEDRRRQSDKQAQPAVSLSTPAPASAAIAAVAASGQALSDTDTSVTAQIVSHRLRWVRVGLFLGSELVRWLKRSKAVGSTRDAVIWGNFLLQHCIIRACRAPYPSQSHQSASSDDDSASQPGTFRYAAIWYEVQPSEHHLKHTCDRHPTHSAATASAGNTAQSALDDDSPLISRASQQTVPFTSVAPSPAPSSELTKASSARIPTKDGIVIPVVEKPSAADTSRLEADGKNAEVSPDEDPNALLSLSVLCAPSVGAAVCDVSPVVVSGSSRSSPSSLSVPLLSGWEFVQSFGDDSNSYDFADADDLVTAVEFHPSGEYLAIGDKAGRVSIVEEATLRRDGSRGNGDRQRNSQQDSSERVADHDDEAGLHNPLEFRSARSAHSCHILLRPYLTSALIASFSR